MNERIAPRRVTKFGKGLREIRTDWLLYVMILPGVVYFIIFHYLPMFGISIAFTDYTVIKGFNNLNFVKLKWFETLFSRKAFINALTNNIKFSLIKITFGFPLPIIVSILISEVWNRGYRRMVQTTVILPSFLSWFVIYGILKALCNVSDGVIPGFLTWMNQVFGTNIEIVNYMTNKSTFTVFVMLTYIWRELGMGTVVYLAAITGIDSQLYEAAMIDGAGRIKQIWHITLSCLRPTIIVLLIFRVGNIMNAGFDQMFALSTPLTTTVADIIDTYVYRIGMEESKFTLATAAGFFKSCIGLVFVIATNAIARKVDSDSAIM